MASSTWTKPLLLLSFYISVTTDFGVAHVLESGSCSPICQNKGSQNNGSSVTEFISKNSSPCSCNRGCRFYQDCCYDSEYKEIGRGSTIRMICLSLSNKSRYKAVAGCSARWTGASSFCTESIGHLPPVTSNKTGTTYANVHCAICNDDTENLITWNVQLRCCTQHHSARSERRFTYKRGYIQSVDLHQSKNTQGRCICKFFARDNDNSFVDFLEMRVCEPSLEISRCSSTWRNKTVQELCDSFLDPVYSRDKVYRNVFCAQCNYENLEMVWCKPNVIEQKRSEGASDAEIAQFCIENNLRNCIYFLDVTGRGRSYSFSSLMNINLRECVPEPGRMCCDGEKYDSRTKTCKKINLRECVPEPGRMCCDGEKYDSRSKTCRKIKT